MLVRKLECRFILSSPCQQVCPQAGSTHLWITVSHIIVNLRTLNFWRFITVKFCIEAKLFDVLDACQMPFIVVMTEVAFLLLLLHLACFRGSMTHKDFSTTLFLHERSLHFLFLLVNFV